MGKLRSKFEDLDLAEKFRNAVNESLIMPCVYYTTLDKDGRTCLLVENDGKFFSFPMEWREAVFIGYSLKRQAASSLAIKEDITSFEAAQTINQYISELNDRHAKAIEEELRESELPE